MATIHFSKKCFSAKTPESSENLETLSHNCLNPNPPKPLFFLGGGGVFRDGPVVDPEMSPSYWLNYPENVPQLLTL